jgi:predicted lactoylglutathione lyase
MKKSFLFILFILFFSSCYKVKENELYLDDTRSIQIHEKISVDNGIILHNEIFNFITIDNFLKYLSNSDRFLLVQQKDLEKTTSTDKVIISLRHDIDDNINASVKFAYLENKYGIKSSYFVLHTAKYYGVTNRGSFKRNDDVLYYLKKIQDYGHEIGWHNDLVTLQIMYGLDPREFLKTELGWLRDNGIVIHGTTSHGSEYCDIYHYINSYFWDDVIGNSEGKYYNYEYIKKGFTTFKIEKDSLKNYNLEYEGLLMHSDYFFADSDWPGGKRWNMGMVNLDTIKPGKKVIILLHPQHWD